MANSPLAQKVGGPVGVGAGFVIGMPNYHDANGGDWAFAGLQAGQDAIFAAAGGWAGGAAATAALAGVAALGVVVAAPVALVVIGVAAAAGAGFAYYQSQKLNTKASSQHRSNGWWNW